MTHVISLSFNKQKKYFVDHSPGNDSHNKTEQTKKFDDLTVVCCLPFYKRSHEHLKMSPIWFSMSFNFIFSYCINTRDFSENVPWHIGRLSEHFQGIQCVAMKTLKAVGLEAKRQRL